MRNIIIFALAAVFAAVIAFVVSSNLAPKTPDPQAQADAVRVLVAKSDIGAGTFVNPEIHLAWSPIQKDLIQNGYVLEGSTNIQKYSGAIARVKIMAGEPILPDQLVKTEDGGFMAAVLSPGMRAVTIAVTPVTGNAGFIFPGDKVDVVLTKKAQGGSNEKTYSEVIVRSARVLAIDQKYTNQSTQVELAKTVTLEVNSDEVQAISQADDIGKLSLALISSSKKKEAISQQEPTEDTPTETQEVKSEDTDSVYKPFNMQITKGTTTSTRDFILKKE